MPLSGSCTVAIPLPFVVADKLDPPTLKLTDAFATAAPPVQPEPPPVSRVALRLTADPYGAPELGASNARQVEASEAFVSAGGIAFGW